MIVLAISTVLFVGNVLGHSSYMSNIPNGHSVPNPKSPGSTWEAVGHMSPDDGDGLNSFGEDFKHAGKRWTTQLCQKDSDGDGKTNGEELGDPQCQWTPGSSPTQPASGHPGFVDSHRAGETFTGISITSTPGTQGSEHSGEEHHHSHEKEENHNSHEKEEEHHNSHEKEEHHNSHEKEEHHNSHEKEEHHNSHEKDKDHHNSHEKDD